MYEEEDNRGRNTILAIFGAVFAVALVAIFFLKANKPAPVPAPAAFRPYVSSDKSFAGKVPDDWRRQETGGMGIMSGVTVEKASARIAIMSDLQGSLMGDVARATGAGQQSADDLPPAGTTLPGGMVMPKLPPVKPAVEQVHLADKGRASAGIDDYDEGEMHEFTSPLGEARVSEWTGEEKAALGMGSKKVHGYRATILGGDRRVSVVCKCNDGDWPLLKPAFQTVMASLAPGGG